ncbi:HD domain-containing protein [Chryseobacterium scophthalmum]|uniref:HD domain-containing protein n=1 Tax=Chryseobacterium scophthalmum TaxID=59733 RepID=UPI003D077EF1
MILKDRFESLCLNFTKDKILIEKFWFEIEKKYSGKSRHYHNLQHLETLFEEIEHVKDKIKNFNTISFSIFYHDVIYDATSKLNEEKSADIAKERLEILDVNNDDIQKVYKQILATKSHQKSEDEDTNFLLDADLSVLGKSSQDYVEYTKQIRKEYSIYPDFLYKPGRKKVLQHFLELESIYKTEFFRNKYETQARENIEYELKGL